MIFWSFEKTSESLESIEQNTAQTFRNRMCCNLKDAFQAHQSCGHNDPIRLEVADIPKQNQSDFDGQTADADGSFTSVVPGDKALKVSFNAAEDTWLVQRGFE